MIVNEPLHSLVIAHVIGLYLIIMAIIMIARADYYRGMLGKLQGDSGIIPVSASFGLVLGLIMVVIHNTWIWDTEILITIVSWIILIKSILWLSFPEKMVAIAKVIYSGKLYYVMATIAVLIGLALLTHGFHIAKVVALS
ncbi:MAG: hypothetical protein Q8M03_12900 [Legionella sp.]|nr:hypothetical protein [Legionella sp.]